MREREGKGLEGKSGSEFTWWGSFLKLQALLASEQQAAWQKLAHSRDRLLGEFYHAPSAGGLQTCFTPLFPLLTESIQSLTPPIQSNYNLITISNPVISLLLSHYTAAICFVTISILLTCLSPDFPLWECRLVRGTPRWSALPRAQQGTHHPHLTGSGALSDCLRGLED